MSSPMHVLAAATALAGCSAITHLETAKAPTLAAREPATPFTLVAQDGTRVALADTLAKSHVVLVFYRGHW